MVFIEPQTSAAFEFRKHKITRTSFPNSHGKVITSTACQGRTMAGGVIIDAGCKDDGDVDSRWLHLYVMLSRATSSDDIILLRAPDQAFLTRGPPADLAARLRTFSARTRACRTAAEKFARELGFTTILRGAV